MKTNKTQEEMLSSLLENHLKKLLESKITSDAIFLLLKQVLEKQKQDIQDTLNKKWNEKEFNDHDNSIENWQNYKGIRNINNDVINNYNQIINTTHVHESDGLVYTTNPIQYKCKICGMYYYPIPNNYGNPS